jgi:hypothetical protein
VAIIVTHRDGHWPSLKLRTPPRRRQGQDDRQDGPHGGCRDGPPGACRGESGALADDDEDDHGGRQVLLDHYHADVNGTDKFGSTALMTAACLGHKVVVEVRVMMTMAWMMVGMRPEW